MIKELQDVRERLNQLDQTIKELAKYTIAQLQKPVTGHEPEPHQLPKQQQTEKTNANLQEHLKLPPITRTHKVGSGPMPGVWGLTHRRPGDSKFD